MSFAVYPQPDACRAWMPTPDPAPPGPPSPPLVCHMPKGHDGPHSNERRPTTLSRRWEGDARPPKSVPAAEPPHEFTEDVGDASMCVCGIPVLDHDAVVSKQTAAEPPGETELREQIDRLAHFIAAEVPGEPSESQGAVDTAIRVMRAHLADRKRLEDLAIEMINHPDDSAADWGYDLAHLLDGDLL